MVKKGLVFLLVFSIIVASHPDSVKAQSGIRVVSNSANLKFPSSATFQAEFAAGTKITQVVLEYGVDQMTCGSVVAKAFPVFTPALNVEVEWTWEMLQSGSLPPGANLWWQWKVTDSSGMQITSSKMEVLWLDNIHSWETIQGGNINLHYYYGGKGFGQDLHEAAVQALSRLSLEVGIHPSKSVDIYIYANYNDLRDAILYEPAWIGGQAYPEFNIVIIGIDPSELEWGKDTEAHELTHVLVGQLTFTCLGFIPNWLVEGLAMVGEGGLDTYQQNLLDQAISEDKVPTLQSLTGGFPEESERANLSYAASYSVTDYLISTHGQDKMLDLLNKLSEGSTADEALTSVYGFNVDSLDKAWRTSIGIESQTDSSLATPKPTATVVPTIAPYSGTPSSPYATPKPGQSLAGSNPTPNPAETSRSNPSGSGENPQATPNSFNSLLAQLGINSNIVTIIEFTALICFLALLVLIGPILLTVRRKHRRKP